VGWSASRRRMSNNVVDGPQNRGFPRRKDRERPFLARVLEVVDSDCCARERCTSDNIVVPDRTNQDIDGKQLPWSRLAPSIVL
jgi:hypothetical protein